MSNVTIVNFLFVPLRYLQFLKIVRSTAAAAENEPCKVCPIERSSTARCWTLIPCEVAEDFLPKDEDEEDEKETKVPCLLSMESLTFFLFNFDFLQENETSEIYKITYIKVEYPENNYITLGVRCIVLTQR